MLALKPTPAPPSKSCAGKLYKQIPLDSLNQAGMEQMALGVLLTADMSVLTANNL